MGALIELVTLRLSLCPMSWGSGTVMGNQIALSIPAVVEMQLGLRRAEAAMERVEGLVAPGDAAWGHPALVSAVDGVVGAWSAESRSLGGTVDVLDRFAGATAEAMTDADGSMHRIAGDAGAAVS